MSNYQTVNLPRELAERIAKVCMFTMFAKDSQELRAILARPSGEPAAWFDPVHNDFLTAEGRVTTLHMGDGDRLARYTVPLYAAPTAAEELDSVRHWRAKHDVLVRELAAVRQHKNDYMQAAEETRAALMADVERLRNELEEAKGEYDRSANLVAQLQADLTERDEQIDALRQGMKGDYDLDAWLAFVEEAPLLRLDAGRYRWLRSRDLEAISQGGVFAGLTPDNLVLNEETLDQAIDAAMAPDFVELSTHGRLNGVTP